MDGAQIRLYGIMMPIVSTFGSNVDIGLVIGIGQYRKGNIG